MHSLLASFMSGFLLGFGIAIGNYVCLVGSILIAATAVLLRVCEGKDGAE